MMLLAELIWKEIQQKLYDTTLAIFVNDDASIGGIDSRMNSEEAVLIDETIDGIDSAGSLRLDTLALDASSSTKGLDLTYSCALLIRVWLHASSSVLTPASIFPFHPFLFFFLLSLPFPVFSDTSSF